jgi:hypothetical protein
VNRRLGTPSNRVDTIDSKGESAGVLPARRPISLVRRRSGIVAADRGSP